MDMVESSSSLRPLKEPHKILNDYLGYLSLERGLADNTLKAYGCDLRHLIEYLEPMSTSLANVEESDLHQFLTMLHEIGITPRSQARMIASMRSFFKFLRLEGYIDTDPSVFIENPRLPRHLPDVLSVEEIDAMIACLDMTKAEGQRNRAIIETLYGCGLRVSELTELRISKIYADDGYIIVDGKGSKQRLVPICSSTMQEITRYIEERHILDIKPGHEDFLFLNRRGRKLTRVMIFYIIRDLAKLAGIEKTVSPHTLRHSFASHLLEGGANLRAIQEMLGHEDIGTTEIYLHFDKSMLHKELLLHHPLYSNRI